MSSKIIEQKLLPKPQQKKVFRFLKSFAVGVAKASGGTVLGITMISSSIVAGGLAGLAISFRNLPDVRVLKNYVPSETSYVYDMKGRLLTNLHGEANREIVSLNQMSPELKRAVIAIEDSNFYLHKGVNLYSIGRALVANLKKGEVSQGASTITMQLVKNLFLTQERTITRKLAEAILAIRIEQVFSKDEILEMYLNNIYWGHQNYGVQTAAETYFAKDASELNLAEASVMAGLIQSPQQYSPYIKYSATKARQTLVLKRMAELGWITSETASQAKQQPLLVNKPTAWQTSKSQTITDAVIAELESTLGRDVVRRGGIRVQSTIDIDYQQMAERSVIRSYWRLRRQGVRTDQVALAAVDPRTHYVKAVVPGVHKDKNQFNRATLARRQPGSSFKPFVYYAAFASGKYSPYSLVYDTPITYKLPNGEFYRPQNYGGRKDLGGRVSIYNSIIKSRNIPAVKLGVRLGLDKIIEICKSLGIKSPLKPVYSLPLGSVGVTPLEMAGAFATFASNGWHSDVTTIVQATDGRGNLLIDNRPEPKLILDPWATASLTNTLQGVLRKGGTAEDAWIGRPAAGKTGTTSSERDVWFVGYVPQLSVAVWVGNDNNSTLGRGATGGKHAAPVWRSFMFQALRNEPKKYFAAPSQFRRP